MGMMKFQLLPFIIPCYCCVKHEDKTGTGQRSWKRNTNTHNTATAIVLWLRTVQFFYTYQSNCLHPHIFPLLIFAPLRDPESGQLFGWESRLPAPSKFPQYIGKTLYWGSILTLGVSQPNSFYDINIWRYREAEKQRSSTAAALAR